MVRLPVFVRWLVITLGWMLAEPEELTLRVFPVILQLVPDVPVWPYVEMVRSCAFSDSCSEKTKHSKTPKSVRDNFIGTKVLLHACTRVTLSQ